MDYRENSHATYDEGTDKRKMVNIGKKEKSLTYMYLRRAKIEDEQYYRSKKNWFLSRNISRTSSNITAQNVEIDKPRNEGERGNKL